MTRELLAVNLAETRLACGAATQNLLAAVTKIFLAGSDLCRRALVQVIAKLLIKNLPTQMVSYLKAQQQRLLSAGTGERGGNTHANGINRLGLAGIDMHE